MVIDFTKLNTNKRRVNMYKEMSFSINGIVYDENKNLRENEGDIEIVKSYLEDFVRLNEELTINPEETFIEEREANRDNLGVLTYEGKELKYSMDYSWTINKGVDTTTYTIKMFESLSNIYNDETYQWKADDKRHTMTTTFTKGNFEFVCTYREKEDTMYIDVKYAKRENYHRNKATIDMIEVIHPANWNIKDAIDMWTKEFSKEISEVEVA